MIPLARGATAVVLSAFALAAPARADEASFIDYMRSHGQSVLPGGEGSWIAGGHHICDRIREAGPEAGMRLVSPMPRRDPATYVEAAQHELCPETLGAKPSGSSSAAAAGPTEADEDSYLQYLRDHGQWIVRGTEGNWLSGGFRICDRIRVAGREAGMKLVSPMEGRDPVTVVDAAQHDLCPDTLGARS